MTRRTFSGTRRQVNVSRRAFTGIRSQVFVSRRTIIGTRWQLIVSRRRLIGIRRQINTLRQRFTGIRSQVIHAGKVNTGTGWQLIRPGNPAIKAKRPRKAQKRALKPDLPDSIVKFDGSPQFHSAKTHLTHARYLAVEWSTRCKRDRCDYASTSSLGGSHKTPVAVTVAM